MRTLYKKTGKIAAWAGIFIAFTAAAAGGVFNRIDRIAADAFAALANPFADKVFSAARSIGDMNNCKLLAAAMALYAFFKRWNRLAVSLMIAFALLFWAGGALKKAVGKERPPAAYARERYIPVSSKSFAYPSGHTSKAAFLFFTLALLARKSALSKRASPWGARLAIAR